MSKRRYGDFFLRLLLLAIFGPASSCSRDGCPLSSGSSVSRTRSLPGFHEIILYDNVNLILTQDSVQQVRVEGGGNLLPGIQTTVADSALTIRDNNKCSLLRSPGDPVNVYISSGLLNTITYYGAGNVVSTNTLRNASFIVNCWMGSGSIKLDVVASSVSAYARNQSVDITLTGSADNAWVYCQEVGSVDLSGLVAQVVFVESKSVRDTYVNATNSMKVTINYKGNVYYKGNPAYIDSLFTSSGRLIRMP